MREPGRDKLMVVRQTVPSQEVLPTAQRCVNAQGFSLHAEVRCAINQHYKLEHITRPAIANERLTLNRPGQVVLTLKTPYRLPFEENGR